MTDYSDQAFEVEFSRIGDSIGADLLGEAGLLDEFSVPLDLAETPLQTAQRLVGAWNKAVDTDLGLGVPGPFLVATEPVYRAQEFKADVFRVPVKVSYEYLEVL